MYNMNSSISIGTKKFTFRVEVLILIIFLLWLLWTHVLCSCSKVKVNEGFLNNIKEGFIGGNNISYSAQFANYQNPQKVNTNKWPMPTLTFTPGSKPSAAVQKIWNRKKQPIPLPKGELDMFATTEFKGECCPNTYSTSTGCACMTVDQYSYLRHRGGNNVPYSEY